MNDRELLELAAKAAGYAITDWCAGRRGADWAELSDTSKWNPIEDDGDALRLEVVLKAASAWEPTRGGWSVGAIVNDEFKWLAFHNDRKRASTMAAAEIGRQMREGGAA